MKLKRIENSSRIENKLEEKISSKDVNKYLSEHTLMIQLHLPLLTSFKFSYI